MQMLHGTNVKKTFIHLRFISVNLNIGPTKVKVSCPLYGIKLSFYGPGQAARTA
jgi:hypothetical protein